MITSHETQIQMYSGYVDQMVNYDVTVFYTLSPWGEWDEAHGQRFFRQGEDLDMKGVELYGCPISVSSDEWAYLESELQKQLENR